MSDALDVAYVEIVPRFGRFNTEVRRGIDEAARDIERRLSRVLNRMERSFENAGTNISRSTEAAFDKVSDDAEQAGRQASRSIDNAAENISDSLRTNIGDASDDARESIEDIGDESRTTFEGVGDDAERAGERVTKASEESSDDSSRAFTRLNAVVGRLRKSFSGISDTVFSMQGRFLTLTVVITAAVAAIVDAAQELGGLFAVLPALAAVAGAGIATVAVVTRGMGDAFAAAFEDSEEFEESLQSLSPAAQSVAREFRALVPRMREVSDQVQDAAFEQLDGQLTAVAANLEGPLTQGLTDAAEAFGGILEQIGEFGQQEETARAVGLAFEAVTSIFDALAEATVPFLEGLRTITLEFLPRLVAAEGPLSRMGDAFRDWADAAVETGSAMREFDEALDFLGDILAIVRNIGEAFGSMFDVAQESGISFAQTLVDLTDDMAAFFASAEGQDFLGDFLPGVDRIVREVGPLLGTLALAFGGLADPIADILEEIGPDLEDIILNLGDAFRVFLEEAAPAFEAVAEAVSDINFAAFAENVGRIVGALGPLIGLLLQLGFFAGTFIPNLIGILIEMFTVGGGVIARFFADLPRLAIQGLTILFTTFLEWGLAFREWWNGFWTGFGEVVSGFFTSALEIILQGLVIVAETFIEWGIGARERWNAFWARFAEIVSNFFITLLEIMIQGFVIIRETIAGWLSSIRERVIRFTLRVREIWNSLWSAVSSRVSRAWESISDIVSDAVGGVRRVLSGMSRTFRRIFDSVVGTVLRAAVRVASAVARIRDALASVQQAPSSFLAAARGFLPGFADGGIITGPTQALVGEAGPEVVIPLTRPQRAMELVRESGLMNLLGAGSLGALASQSSSTASAGGGQSVVIADGAVRVEFTGATPSEDQGRRVGAAVGNGLMDTIAARNATLAVRTLG